MEASPRNKRRRLGVIEPPKLTELLSDEPTDDARVCQYLRKAGFNDDIILAFKRNKVEYNHLFKFTTDTLTHMGIEAIGDQMNILDWIHTLQTGDEKVFNDPIHGHIELHPLLVAIIDTPQFQRLRYIKQLGGGYYVFPGASHNRFEHSLGVSYLAGQFIESIQSRQVELGITQSDVLCVMVAGLCHDLGHGPFSHMFDLHFIPKVPGVDDKWRHEQGSVDMLDYLIEDNKLWPTFEKYGLTLQDLIFIKELIVGPLKKTSENKEQQWPYQGRNIDKSFLYEIVANKRNGVDVDKWDYFARDCYCLGIPNSFDRNRYMKFARVIEVDGMKQICCRDKEVVNLYEMFHTRTVLHRRAYQHKTAQAVEIMLTEALLAANDHLKIAGKNNQLMRMSDAISDMVAYTKLTDSVIQMIKISNDINLKKAQSILHDVERRHLYKCIGQTQPSPEIKDDDAEEIKKQIVESLPDSTLTTSNLHVRIATFDYGMKDKNPIDRMRFYTKRLPNKAVKVRRDQVSQMLPNTFVEKNIRVYCKKLDQKSLDLALKCFKTWCVKQDHLMTPKGEVSFSDPAFLDDSLEQDFTPYGTPFGTPVKHDDIDTPIIITAPSNDESNTSTSDTKKKINF